jgi:4-alpha-glucanotransferase
VEVRNRKDFALEQARDTLQEPILYHKFLQFHFYRQLADVKRYCESKGVGLIGDIPIFVAHDSADVWAHPELFWLDPEGKPTVVAGVPPDYFSATGQLWGNPHYRWAVMRERGYDWWVNRFRAAFQIFDAIRLDHFIGFQKYWEIAAGSDTAQNGRWVDGPGADFFAKVFSDVPNAEFIAEDLGVVTPDVEALRDQFHLPGMRVLQFAFNGGDIHLPHNYVKNCVAYTGTHDNNTIKGWFLHDESKAGRKKVLDYCESAGTKINWDLIRLVQMSVANTAIVPVQDLLGLDGSARMNTPGTNANNWTWRLPPKTLTTAIAKKLADLTETYARAR